MDAALSKCYLFLEERGDAPHRAGSPVPPCTAPTRDLLRDLLRGHTSVPGKERGAAGRPEPLEEILLQPGVWSRDGLRA